MLRSRSCTGARALRVAALLFGLAGASAPARAYRVADAAPVLGTAGPAYLRWDAAPRSVEATERSLAGGLRYSGAGGSYAAFRDQFTWTTVPTVAEFQSAVEQAFAAWTATDPQTGLGTSLSFVADLSTPAVDEPGDLGNPLSFLGLNDGAEIDLFADTPHLGPAYGASVIFFADPASLNSLTLTSGTTGYAGVAISGADVRINPDFVYGLDEFRILLTHEIGHTIGFTDADVFPGPLGINSAYFDDDYDGTNSATALATLTNSFALEIDPFDPDSTPLIRVSGDLNGDPGLDTPGVDVLMETQFNFALALANPPLQNDDFAGRHFLYPVPEPGTFGLLGLGLGALGWLRGARRSSPS